MLESYLTLWHLKMLVLWILANCAAPWYAIWTNRRLKPVKGREQEKHMPWVRTDIAEWSYLICPFTHFFFIPRWLGMLAVLIITLIGCIIMSIGADIENLSDSRKWVFRKWTQLSMILIGAGLGAPWWKHSRKKVDYSKWLGPDWKPTYDGATMVVSNHTSYCDVFTIFLFLNPMPGFIAKTSIKGIPAVGPCATAAGSMFLDRRDKAQKRDIFHQIRER